MSASKPNAPAVEYNVIFRRSEALQYRILACLLAVGLTSVLPTQAGVQPHRSPITLTRPKQWGNSFKGIYRYLNTKKRTIALTFDACDSRHQPGYDSVLIRYLEFHRIPATFFVSGKWIKAHPAILKRWARNPLFEIENHGLRHLPCSAIGRSAYGIHGTHNIKELLAEIQENAKTIERITGVKPKFFRPATTFCDEIAVGLAEKQGYKIVGFSINGDGGATFPAATVTRTLLKSFPGAIVLCHLNHPEKGTGRGVIKAIPLLQKQGYTFAKLADIPLR